MNKILEQYYRKPQVYIALPSQGQFYNSGCKLSVDNQLAVRAMTAADEILLKNPEALLNGEAVINLIKSCCPDITNAEEVSIVDLDAILIAIRHATYGENLQFNSSCNHCKSSNELEIHYGKFLETIIPIDKDPYVEINSDIKCLLQPTKYISSQKISIAEFEYNSLVKAYSNNPTEDQKKEISISRSKRDNFRINIISESIRFIKTPQESITDRNEISEFVFNLDSVNYLKIFNCLEKLNANTIKKEFDIECASCKKLYTQIVNFDNSSFFD